MLVNVLCIFGTKKSCTLEFVDSLSPLSICTCFFFLDLFQESSVPFVLVIANVLVDNKMFVVISTMKRNTSYID